MTYKFKQHQQDPDDDAGISWVTCVAVAFALALYFWFVVLPNKDWKYGQQELGQLGDFLGGLINPIVGLLTVYLILKSIKIQRKELHDATEAFSNQNDVLFHQTFEQTFFAWLASYRDIVSSVFYESGNIQYNGRKALHVAMTDLMPTDTMLVMLKTKINSSDFKALSAKETVSLESSLIISGKIVLLWENTYGALRTDIDSMFRTLYRLIMWIDEHKLLSTEDKWHYVAILRAQVSHAEMVCLFYNGFTNRGARFNKYSNKYALFDNLDSDTVLRHFLRNLPYNIDQKAGTQPYSAGAFNSDIARANLLINTFKQTSLSCR